MAVIGIGTASRATVEDVLAVIDKAMAKLGEFRVPPHPTPLPEGRGSIKRSHLAERRGHPPLLDGRGKIERFPLSSGEENVSVPSPPGEKDRMRGSLLPEEISDEDDAITALASLDRPSINAVLRDAALLRNLELVLLPLDRLRAVSHLCVTHSKKSMKQYGIPSVAEAAALAAAGAGARLLLPRICGRRTTASVAA
jgi:Cobalamin synthesis G C-terminus